MAGRPNQRPVLELAQARIVADHAVVGLASGYTTPDIAPFLRSLRACGYDGEIVLLMDDFSIDSTRGSEVIDGVQIVRVPALRSARNPTLRRIRRSKYTWPALCAAGWLAVKAAGLGATRPRGAERQRAVAGRGLHPMLARHFHYRRLVENSQFGHVLLTDVRDVLFQSDPFANLKPSGLTVGLESEDYTLATEHWNSIWIRTGFGAPMLERIGANRATCAGVVGGEGGAVRDYLRQMTDTILGLPTRGVVPFGTDQGVHNVLVWTGALPELALVEPMSGPIITLNCVGLDTLSFDAAGRLVNHDDTPISIIHQYDRVPGLDERLSGLAGQSAVGG